MKVVSDSVAMSNLRRSCPLVFHSNRLIADFRTVLVVEAACLYQPIT